MTSSNVIEYIIFDKELNEVGRHRQNIMCHTNNDGLEKFRPFSDFIILPYGYDENEEYWEGNNENLQDCLSWINPVKFPCISYQSPCCVSKFETL